MQLVMEKPLWIFANELSPEEVAKAVDGASEEQTIVIVGLSEELAQVISLPRAEIISLTSEKGLPAMFSQTPMATRDKVFAEVGPFWQVSWADLGGDGSASSPVDLEKLYLAGVQLTMRLEDSHRHIEANKQAQAEGSATETTGTTDPYPILRTVESKQAEALAQKVADYVSSLTGRKMQIREAGESQMIGPGGVLEHREHNGMLVLPDSENWLNFGAFWSDEDQIDHAIPNGPGSGLPTVWFDAGEGSKGYISARSGYYCRLQLADGITVLVSTGSPANKPRLPTLEASVLTADQMISLTKWLAVQAEYLHP